MERNASDYRYARKFRIDGGVHTARLPLPVYSDYLCVSMVARISLHRSATIDLTIAATTVGRSLTLQLETSILREAIAGEGGAYEAPLAVLREAPPSSM